MTDLQRLENELARKKAELDRSRNEASLLLDALKSNTETLADIESLLSRAARQLSDSNEYIHTLQQENRMLKSSCEQWMKRAVKLELQLLRINGEAAQ